MSAVGAILLDGSDIGTQLWELKERLDGRKVPDVISASEFPAIAEAEAASIMYGIPGVLPDGLHFKDLHSLPFNGLKLDKDSLTEILHDYLNTIADLLKDDPLVVSVLDGSEIRLYIENEYDFAKLAANIFTDLDKDHNGKLSKDELRSALFQMGVGMGIPPVTAKPEADALLMDILKKHGAEGAEELGQDKFAKLLQGILQDIANSLASEPLVVIRDIKVNNGSQVRKILENEKFLCDVINMMFEELDVNKDGKISKSELRPLFERKGSEFGLPPFNDKKSVSLLYDHIFQVAYEDKSKHLEKKEFQILVKAILQSFVDQLSANPIYLNSKFADSKSLRHSNLCF